MLALFLVGFRAWGQQAGRKAVLWRCGVLPGPDVGLCWARWRDRDRMLIRGQQTETQGLHTVSFVSGNRASCFQHGLDRK